MPELPELEVVRDVLQHRVVGATIERVEIVPPGGAIVVRDLTHGDFAAALTGATISAVARRGKFLVFSLPSLYLVLNPKLTGRLQLTARGDKRMAKTHLVLALSSGDELRYVDQKTMGQLYLTRDLNAVPDYAGLGPEPFDISLDDFRARLKPYRGEIKASSRAANSSQGSATRTPMRFCGTRVCIHIANARNLRRKKSHACTRRCNTRCATPSSKCARRWASKST